MSHVIGEYYDVMFQGQCVGRTRHPFEVGRVITSVPWGRFKIVSVDHDNKIYDTELVEYL